MKSAQTKLSNQKQAKRVHSTNPELNGIKQALSKMSSKLASLEQLRGYNLGTFSHEREEGLKEMYAEYRDNILADYIYGIYHPDVVFKENLEVKSPSYLPVPTTTFRFKETFTLKPNTRGNFVIYWSPNYLATQSVLDKEQFGFNSTYAMVFVNNSENLDGHSEAQGEWKAIPFHTVTQDFEMYRLTSACIKVRYTGQVLQQSGMLAAAASYTRSYRTTVCRTADQGNISEYMLLDRWSGPLHGFSDFDNIRQGQWAETCSLVDRPEGITCVYVPTDPLNQVFVDNGTTIDSVSAGTLVQAEIKYSAWQPKNANISYAICGYGITADSDCITVEAYYNYEIIVRQEQFPYFTPKVASSKLLKHINVLSAIGSLVSSSGLITKSHEHDSPTIWSKVRAAFSKAGRLFTDVYPYLSPLYRALV